MHSNASLAQNKDSSTRRIIPFPNRRQYSASYASRSIGIIESQGYNTKEDIEAKIYEFIINKNLLENEKETNPFGSIYLCDLKPDKIDYSYIEKIKIFSNIKDLSDTIHFNDGMDD
jgi:hypothetical protein